MNLVQVYVVQVDGFAQRESLVVKAGVELADAVVIKLICKVAAAERTLADKLVWIFRRNCPLEILRARRFLSVRQSQEKRGALQLGGRPD